MTTRVIPHPDNDGPPPGTHEYEISALPTASLLVQDDGQGRWYLLSRTADHGGSTETLAVFRHARAAKFFVDFLDATFDEVNRAVRARAPKPNAPPSPSTDSQ